MNQINLFRFHCRLGFLNPSMFLALSFLLMVAIHDGWAADLNRERAEIEGSFSRFQLEMAEEQIGKLSDRGYQKFYACNLLMYKFFATQDVSYIQQVRGSWKSTLSTLQTLPEEDPLKYVLLSELYCKRSAIEVLDQKYLTAVRLARTGRSLIRRNQHRHEDNIEQLKILGIMNIVLGAIPAKYQWIIHSLGFKGDLVEGVRQLELAASQSSLLRLEAQLVLSFVEKNILDRPEAAILRMKQIRAEGGGNLVIDYFLATGLIGVKRSEEALAILSQRDLYIDQGVFFVPFWDYQLGRAYSFKNDHRNSQRYLARFLKAYKGKLVKTDANFRLGMALTLNGSYELGKQFFKTIAEVETSDLDQDAYAQHMAAQFLAQKPGENLQSLFRARNFFDGGYYDQAQKELAHLQARKGALSAYERTELSYRLGRIFHAQGQLEEAIQQYQDCISQPVAEETTWLHAYAWFYEASIAKEQGQIELAKERYQKALSFDGYFYQTGLENRCKAALSDLKQNG